MSNNNRRQCAGILDEKRSGMICLGGETGNIRQFAANLNIKYDMLKELYIIQ